MNRPDPALLKIFADEQSEHVHRMRVLADSLSNATEETAAPVLDELLRRAHTLKGAARAVGIEETERLIHRMEEVFLRLREQGAPPDTAILETIRRALDRTEDILGWILGERTEPERTDIFPGASIDTSAAGPPEQPRQPEAAEPGATPAHVQDLVRVDAGILDEVIRTASQLITTSTVNSSATKLAEEHAANLDAMVREYQRRKRACVSYVRRNREDFSFSPVAECFRYVDEQFGALLADSRAAAFTLQQRAWELRQQVQELYQNASRTRMTPAEGLFSVFGAMVRGLAEQEGKQIDFRADGLELQADRVVLQALKDPVMHLLRNAVSHGIERPEERTASGKDPLGHIRLLLRSRGDRLTLRVEDDGRGLDRTALAAEAVRKGFLSQIEADVARPEDLAKFVFQSGFSTSRSVSRLSGRGIGLAVVKETVNHLRGDVGVRARVGGGTIVSISLPLSISTQHVLLVAENLQTFAIPAALVESVRKVRVNDVVLVDGRESIVADSEPVSLVKLSDLLGLKSTVAKEPQPGTATDRSFQAMILNSGADRLAVSVDEILDDREAVVKEIGLNSSMAGASAGAIALEDGTVAVILGVTDLLNRFAERAESPARFIPSAEQEQARRILVVDDSITTRSVEKNILEAHGYDVELAVDGVEAMEKIGVRLPDLIVSDVAMPRMDGFQLLEKIKNGKDTARIPVILVTSLETREEQERGLSLGADAYIIKRKFDQRELLATVRQIL